jgi:hypothetical protein
VILLYDLWRLITGAATAEELIAVKNSEEA